MRDFILLSERRPGLYRFLVMPVLHIQSYRTWEVNLSGFSRFEYAGPQRSSNQSSFYSKKGLGMIAIVLLVRDGVKEAMRPFSMMQNRKFMTLDT